MGPGEEDRRNIAEIQFAVSVGQHRDARYGDTLIGPMREPSIEECGRWMKRMLEVCPKLREAHRVVADRERARLGGLRAAEKLTPEERTERARRKEAPSDQEGKCLSG